MTGKIPAAERVAAPRARYPGAETFDFGDSRALCDRLPAHVRDGKTRATCGALRDDRAGGEPLPVVGRRDIALDRDGFPALVIETTGVAIRRVSEADAGFALSEGEDATLAGRQAGRRACFERTGVGSAEMERVCERFRLIEGPAP